MAARLQQRMRLALNNGELYEAAELATAAAQRLQKDDPQAAAAVLRECAVAQLQQPHAAGALRRGVDCESHVIDVLTEAKADPSDPWAHGARAPPSHCAAAYEQSLTSRVCVYVAHAEALRQLVPAVVTAAKSAAAQARSGPEGAWGVHPDVAGAVHWLQAACKWVAKHGSVDAAGDLHDQAGSLLWEVAGPRGLHDAVLHLCQGVDTARFAAVLASAWSTCPQDRDLFSLRAVAVLLACGGLHRAPALLDALQRHRQGDVDTALDHFLGLYVEALLHGSQSMATALRSRYERALAVDAGFEQLLDEAEARVWPDTRAQTSMPMAGGLAGLLQALSGAA